MSNDCDIVYLAIEKPFLQVEFCDTDPVLLEIKDQFLEVVFPCQLTVNKNFAGGNNEAVICELEAAMAINVNRAVVIQSDGTVVHADKDLISNGLDVIGVAKQSVAIGQLVQVVKFGTLTGAGLATPGDNFWLGNNGVLITAPPTTGTWLFIGTQMTGSEILVRIGEPKIRS